MAAPQGPRDPWVVPPGPPPAQDVVPSGPRALGAFALATVAALLTGGICGLLVGLVFGPLGWFIGFVFGAATALIPGVIVAAVASAVAGAVGTRRGDRTTLPLVLAAVGAVGAAVFAVPVGVGVWPEAGALVAVPIVLTVPVHAVALFVVGQILVGRPSVPTATTGPNAGWAPPPTAWPPPHPASPPPPRTRKPGAG